MTSFKLEGRDEVIKNLRRVQKKTPKRLAAALFKQANKIMTRSKRDYVPVDLGALKSSGKVEKPEIKSGVVSVLMTYGGNAAPYALAVHENPSGFDPPSWKGIVTFSPSGRGPKYLQIPMELANKTLADDLAKDLKL